MSFRDDAVSHALLPFDEFAHGPLCTQPPVAHPAAVYLLSLAPGSRRTMAGALDTIAGALSGGQRDLYTLEWGAVRYTHVVAVRAWLAARYKPATANKMLSALRQVLRHAWKLGQMAPDDYHRARDVANLSGTALPAGRSVAQGEIAALLRACVTDESPAGVRDAAMIALLYSTGMRRSSLVALDLADYTPAEQALHVRAAKGNTEYRVYVAASGAYRALEDWLALRGQTPGSLFWPVNKGGRLTNRRLTDQAVYNLLRKRAAQAGLDHVSPHDLRRTLAGDLLDTGADIVTVQHLLGHSSVNTTARYDRRPESARRKAAAQIHVPYPGAAPRCTDET